MKEAICMHCCIHINNFQNPTWHKTQVALINSKAKDKIEGMEVKDSKVLHVLNKETNRDFWAFTHLIILFGNC